jgi:hypothetical protein
MLISRRRGASRSTEATAGTILGDKSWLRLEAPCSPTRILCDIGQASSFDEEKKGEVLRLVVRGYVEKDGDLFKITPKGQKILTDRGAGLNES